MTGCVEAPFGSLPSTERESSVVYWRSARLLALLAAGASAEAPTAAAMTASRMTPLRKVMRFSSAQRAGGLIPDTGDWTPGRLRARRGQRAANDLRDCIG